MGMTDTLGSIFIAMTELNVLSMQCMSRVDDSVNELVNTYRNDEPRRRLQTCATGGKPPRPAIFMAITAAIALLQPEEKEPAIEADGVEKRVPH